ncbi:MAG: YiiG family protein [Deltaproteobacteria bacterium]|nr:YiiG family protein [Nannocystaceae bacterium]
MVAQPKTFALLLLSLLPLAGCDKLVAAVNDQAQAAAQAAADASTPGGGVETEDDKLGTKLDAYIDCINDFSRSVHDAGDRYLDWVDPKTGPTGKEQNVYGIYQIRDIKTCVDGVTKAADLEPDDPELEAAGKAFIDTLVAAEAPINEAYKYYDEKNYQDDKWAKAKELHPKIIDGMAAFDVADKALRGMVATKNDALQERRLATIEADMGKNLMWHQNKLMIIAKHMIEFGDVAVEPELALDIAKFEPLLTEFEAALDEADKYSKAHKEETDSVTMYSSFVSEAQEFKKAAKELLRRKRDNTKFTKDDYERMRTGPAEWVEGSPAKLSHEYNELVSRSNGLNYSFYKPAPKGS